MLYEMQDKVYALQSAMFISLALAEYVLSFLYIRSFLLNSEVIQ